MATESVRPFARLSSELRLDIWKLVANTPRVLTIRCFPDDRHQELEYFFSPDPAPPILQICQESRAAALSCYTKCLATGTSPRYIWANFNVDTIQIDDFSLRSVKIEEATLIRWLIVESSNTELFDWYYIMDFAAMKSLESLLILSLEKVENWGGTLGWMQRNFEEWFGGVEGWVCPEMRIVQKETGIEMNLHNFQEIIEQSRQNTIAARQAAGLERNRNTA